jgi:hypothetical protein
MLYYMYIYVSRVLRYIPEAMPPVESMVEPCLYYNFEFLGVGVAE